MNAQQYNHRSGLTLVEVTISSLLVGTVVLGSLSMLGASVRSQMTANNLLAGPMLADSLLAEIMSMPYDDPDGASGTLGPESGEGGGSREKFDDADDYNLSSNSPPRNKEHIALTEYSDWTRTAYVYWADQSSGTWSMSDAGLLRIDVIVTAPDGTVTTRYGLRSRDGSLEQPPTLDKTVVTHIESSLTLGSSTSPARGATNLLNHVEDPNDN